MKRPIKCPSATHDVIVPCKHQVAVCIVTSHFSVQRGSKKPDRLSHHYRTEMLNEGKSRGLIKYL